MGSALGLAVDEATVICNSNKLAPRLVPCDIFARAAFVGQEVFGFEIEIGEPHPGNLLATAGGVLFTDLETCCRGPVEFDLAHVPEPVGEAYAGVDGVLLQECRRLVLAMVAAWRWDADDRFPSGEKAGLAPASALRAGPPWPTLDAVMNAVTEV